MLLWIAIMLYWKQTNSTNVVLAKHSVSHFRTYIASLSYHVSTSWTRKVRLEYSCSSISQVILIPIISTRVRLSCLQAQPQRVMQSVCCTSSSSSCSRPSSPHGNAACLLQPKSSAGPAVATADIHYYSSRLGPDYLFNSLCVSSLQAFCQIERARNTSRTTFHHSNCTRLL